MRFVVGDVVRADEDVNLRADAGRIAVGAENGTFFAADDAGLPILRPERGEQSGDAGIQADVRVGSGSVVLAKGGEQGGEDRVIQRGGAKRAETALNQDTHLLHDGGIGRHGQLMVAECLLGGDDGA